MSYHHIFTQATESATAAVKSTPADPYPAKKAFAETIKWTPHNVQQEALRHWDLMWNKVSLPENAIDLGPVDA